MPPRWEQNKENTLEYPDKWGEDLIWNWLIGKHATYKNEMSAQWRWDTNPKEIVRICHTLTRCETEEKIEGRRSFVYQTLGGYWDEENKTFQYGAHPFGFKWNSRGKLVADQHKELHQMTKTELHIASALNMVESEWIDRGSSRGFPMQRT